MTGIYFSGTGNTRWCVERLLSALGGGKSCAMEDPASSAALRDSRDILLGYPIYFSTLPKFVRGFLEKNEAAFAGKRVFILSTMGLFSGDGAGCAARLVTKWGAQVTGGVHVIMPDCIADEKLLKGTGEKNRALVRAAGEKLERTAEKIKLGQPPRDGLSFPAHAAGLLGQRLWFGRKTKTYSDKLRIDGANCIGCGACVAACPLQNLSLPDGRAKAGGRCTMCYRCVNLCPAQAITLLGRKVFSQSRIEKHVGGKEGVV